MDYHIVFNKDRTYRCDVPWKDNENKGLPQWFFDEDCISFEVTLAKDQVEWVPPVGPAPVWTAKLSDFKARSELWQAFETWYRTYY